jgi:2-polyprenyl-3-methyl-5-hydroxy-6-metoxy-1,4-benzoquinol methylase
MGFACRVCDAVDFELIIDFGNQPWCNHFLKENEIGTEPFYPLRLLYCNCCQTVQLDHTVPKEIMFGNHTYLSGITTSLSEHFRNIANEADQRFCAEKEAKSVLDIGSNDGTQLKHFKELGFDVLGVESSKTTAEIASRAGINTLNRFFNLPTAQEINRKFDIINAAGVLFHLEELHSVLDGITFSLAEDGVFVVQFLYMKRIVENCAFDQIYHEHLLYYNLKTLNHLLNRHGMEIFDAYLAPIHGGSMIAFVSHQGTNKHSERLEKLIFEEQEAKSNDLTTYRDFARRIQVMKKENLAFLESRKRAGKTIFGLGAPVKGNTLLNYFGVGTQYLDCLTERNALRDGLYSPGMHIPVVMEDENLQHPDVYYVLAWNFKKEILARNKALLEQGVEFYFPVNPEGIK